MNKFIILILASFVFTLAEENNFFLPDLFITAKNESKINIAEKKSENIKNDWSYKWYDKNLNATNSVYERELFESVSIKVAESKKMFNEAEVFFGFPAFLGFSINHGYYWNNLPYFISLKRYASEKLYKNDVKNGGDLFACILIEKDSLLNAYLFDQSIKDSKLNFLELAYKGFYIYPVEYRAGVYNAGAYAGNSAVTYLDNKLKLDFGEQYFLNDKHLTKASMQYLFSKNTSYLDATLTLGRDHNFMGIPHRLDVGINPWIYSGANHLGLMIDDYVVYKTSRDIAYSGHFSLGREELKMDSIFRSDWLEVNDDVLLPDEKVGVTITVNNYFQKSEDVFVKLNSYSNKKYLDDRDNDGYYSYENYKDFLELVVGAKSSEVTIYDEKFIVLIQFPFYNKSIPNQFKKFSEIQWKKKAFNGEAKAILSYYFGELGNSVTGANKNAYADLRLGFDSMLSEDFWWGLEFCNLLSSGMERLSGHGFDDPYAFVKFRINF